MCRIRQFKETVSKTLTEQRMQQFEAQDAKLSYF
jgi:hypothetical protein